MKKILIILIIVISCFIMAGCSDYCAYCKSTNTSETSIDDNWLKVVCNGCGRTYYMKKLSGEYNLPDEY